MIERLLAAFAEGGEDGGPRPGVGAEEIADILWLATRVDAADRPQAAGPTPTDPEPPPATERPAPAAELPADLRADEEAAAQFFPAARPGPAVPRDPAGQAAGAVPAAAAARRGTALRLPRAPSLDDPLALMRALRPVGRRNIGGPGEELDEQLTVERSIERMVLTPVLRPAESRWLDVALVVDAHHSMLLWSDLVEEVRGVLTRSGVFRDVRAWRLTGTGPGGTPMVAHGRDTPPRNPLELADPAGRRLILVLSDTVAGGWREAPLRRVLRQWSAHNAVAVLNVLPERLWTRGAVSPVPFAVRADRPAAATRSWQRVPMVRRARGGGAVVPVVGIASGSLARLIRVVSGDGRWRRLACLRLDAEPKHEAAYETPEPSDPFPDPLDAIERFRASASPTAQRLAAHLAAVPLTLPVMTLVRRSLLRDSEHSHLAEVALGGLFAPWGAEQATDQPEFEFLPGVREALLGSQLRGDVAAVRELVRRRVWEYMSRHRGTGRDFTAIRLTDGAEGRREVPDGSIPFATAARPEPGLADRVVRVRFEPTPEPQSVGVLLSARMVLAVGEGIGRNAIAWVRAGGRELSCRSVWWDGATPTVFLLLADEDLVDPRAWPPPRWGEGAGEGARLRVDGFTDQGEPASLTGEALPYEGERNGEIVRLSSEPQPWTHYVGAPVSRGGRLAGIVHTVWPDRMVFLSGRALLEQPGFREVLTAHARAGSEISGICLAVRTEVAVGPIGRSVESAMVELLMQAEGETGVMGMSAPAQDGVLCVTVADPDALGKAGLLLAALPGALARLRAGSGEWEVSLAVALARGEFTADGEGVSGPAPEEAGRLVRRQAVAARLGRRAGPGAIVLVTGESLRDVGGLDSLRVERMDPDVDLEAESEVESEVEAEEPPATSGPGKGAGGGPAGWFCLDTPADMARALIDAGLRVEDPAVDWQHCGYGATAADPAGCVGIRMWPREYCLAHLAPDEQAAQLREFRPGGDVDLRGTTFADGLLERLLHHLRDPSTGHVRMGAAAFERAHFVDEWSTVGAEFDDRTSFDRAVFDERAGFESSRFKGTASFGRTVFRRGGAFDGSTFDRDARFGRADFGGSAGFKHALFVQGFDMAWAELWGETLMSGTRVRGAADFAHTVFHGGNEWALSAFLGRASFAHTVWGCPVAFEGVRFGGQASFDHATFAATARFAHVHFEERTTFERADFADTADFVETYFAQPSWLPYEWRVPLTRPGAVTFVLDPLPGESER
ncbi:pentapeptide repeat-containing protein [Streptomyces sp. ISL-43]|uniref:pentapeptide repeat-containing protein n=1 Tax=Streptomyces sp. ISL-43 TaxID=2819183 RepID=UPI001BEA8216|nr:pentapeptide repeat-containing protein [Streptomyces sp. ISL-43]MBT2446545.1 pentapeptide repeat-containing protein [Streptomyces sp. ISL-43]